MGASAVRIGLMVRPDGFVDALLVAIIELKAALNSFSSDCSELNS